MSKRIIIPAICVFIAVVVAIAFVFVRSEAVKSQKTDSIKKEVSIVFADYSKTLQTVDFEKMQKAYVDAANQSSDNDYDIANTLHIDLQGMEKYISKDVLEDAQKTGELISYILYFTPQMGVSSENVFSAKPQNITVSGDLNASVPPDAMVVTSKSGKVSQAKASKYSSGTDILPVSFMKTDQGWILDFDAIHNTLASNSSQSSSKPSV